MTHPHPHPQHAQSSRLYCLAGPGYIEAEENKYIKYFCLVSKIVVVVVVVLHGQFCVVNENCLYKAILKTNLGNFWKYC